MGLEVCLDRLLPIISLGPGKHHLGVSQAKDKRKRSCETTVSAWGLVLWQSG